MNTFQKLAAFLFDPEIPADRLQEDGVIPPSLDVEQVQRVDILMRMDATANQFLGLVHETPLTRQAMSRADYRNAMSQLAAADEARCPVRVPRTGKR